MLAGVVSDVPRVPLLSTVDGEWVRGPLDGEYWYRNLRRPVRFDQAVRTLTESGYRAFVEVSPHPVLTSAIEHGVEATLGAEADGTVVAGTLHRDDGGLTRLITSAAELHVRGVDVDWAALLPGARRVELPTYAFQRKRYWLAPGPGDRADVSAAGLDPAAHPLLGAVVSLPGDGGLVLTGRLSLTEQPWLADHAVEGTALLPGAALVELALRAGAEVGCDVLDELVVEAPLPLPEHGGVRVRVHVEQAAADGRRPVSLHAAREDAGPDAWTRHARGFLSTAPSADIPPDVFGTWPPAGAEPSPLDDFYSAMAHAGYGYGPAFRGLRAAWRDGDAVYAEIALPEHIRADGDAYGLHPALLDAAMQATRLAIPDPDSESGVLLPFAWSGVRLHATGATAARVRITARGGGFAIELADPTSAPLLSIGSLVLRAATPGISRTPSSPTRSSTSAGNRSGHRPSLRDSPARPVRRSTTCSTSPMWPVPGRRRCARSSPVSPRRRRRGRRPAPVWCSPAPTSPIPPPPPSGDWPAPPSSNCPAGSSSSVPIRQGRRWCPRSVASGEPQARIQDGVVTVPRLSRAAPGGPVRFGDGTVLITGGTVCWVPPSPGIW
ncbi:Acyl transferase domain-containing protein [Thermostaphylospora chromogena]|uniref:Acyl transferase domain-containing protein n=1 Tax=Thermostaphylospora chromogena TaxID=35622 RepID=A0A1H1I8V3_9ACTN|nr:polyketide synthase dehydratase domain-containing protein [Thermostaphylospora chromogena]SDR33756.1 Acyl transferase domain-containing protein [Thermostaphylospora chromogena]